MKEILIELSKNVEEIKKKLEKLDEEREKLIDKLIDNEMKAINAYTTILKLEYLISTLQELLENEEKPCLPSCLN